jgi:hypothetical protein
MGNTINRIVSTVLRIDGVPLCKHKMVPVSFGVFFTDIRPLMFLYTTLSTWIFGTVLFIREIPCTIEPFYNLTWTLRQDGRSWRDYIYRIPIAWTYLYHLAISDRISDLYKSHNPSVVKTTPSVDASHRALVRLMLGSPAVWRVVPKPGGADGPVQLRIAVNTHTVQTLPQFTYCTKTIDFVLIHPDAVLNPSSWEVHVESSDSSIPHRDQMADAVASILFRIPIGWHSWIHFPYADFSSGWVLKCQEEGKIHGPLYKIMRQHTLTTKWNTTSAKVSSESTHSSADFMETSTGPNDRKSSSSAAFAVTKDTAMGIIMQDVHDNQDWLVHPLFQHMINTPSSWLHQHPTLKAYFHAYTVQKQFVETIWSEVQQEAVTFATYIYFNSGGRLDHRDHCLDLLVRVLLSAGFLHAIDHNLMSVSSLDLLPDFNPVMRANINQTYYNTASFREHEMIDRNVDFNQKVRFPNFVRTFGDHVHNAWEPTMDKIDYGSDNDLIVSATKAYINGLQECIDSLNIMYKAMGLDKHLSAGQLLASKLPISINH